MIIFHHRSQLLPIGHDRLPQIIEILHLRKFRHERGHVDVLTLRVELRLDNLVYALHRRIQNLSLLLQSFLPHVVGLRQLLELPLRQTLQRGLDQLQKVSFPGIGLLVLIAQSRKLSNKLGAHVALLDLHILLQVHVALRVHNKL